MPPYIRRRVFEGWDWFTPRAIQHLPWSEQERLTREAWEAVRRHRRHWLLIWLPASLSFLAAGLVVLGLLLNLGILLCLPIALTLLVHSVAWIGVGVWRQRLFQETLRQKLLDAGIRPRICFECGYQVEGYEGKECPACDVPLLRQSDSPRPMS